MEEKLDAGISLLFLKNTKEATYDFGLRYTADRGRTVSHFQFLHHLGEHSSRMMSNCEV